ncbi:glutaredoxin-C6-like [Olea europaea subsp. europaea]|uniref:Glutaredoxin-C6-like n=1 Tax=Olea europaea subsp. europaea TaxID=158383 RepID=A0A8S0RII1_OLEEU|nr:glutaredoxin-C6-like [Olea europaea subsp. europaea]
MQGVRRYGTLADGGVRLELTSTTTSPLAIDVAESTEMRIQRLISENPVIIFSRSSCCMCHVMKRLLSAIGMHPTVIELEEDEIGALNNHEVAASTTDRRDGGAPALYIGGVLVGGLESLVALHLSGHLVPKLIEVGVLENNMVL